MIIFVAVANYKVVSKLKPNLTHFQMSSLKSELTMTMVKDSLQKEYANDGINNSETETEDEDTSYFEDSDESVDPGDGEKRVKVHHVVEVDGENIRETVDHLDPDDPKIHQYLNGEKDQRDSRYESVDGEKEVRVHHVVELDGKLVGESVDQFDPEDPKLKHYMEGDNNEQEGNEEGDSDESEYEGVAQGGEADAPSEESSEENFDSQLKRAEEEEDDVEDELEGLPLVLVDKEQLENKALEMLRNRKIGSTQEQHNQVSTKSELIENIKRRKVEIEESKKTRESISNSIPIFSNLNPNHIMQSIQKLERCQISQFLFSGRPC